MDFNKIKAMGLEYAEKGKNAAMDLLASVGRRTWNNDDSNSNTVHSVVYDLTDPSVLWVGNEHYGEDGYTFEFQLAS